MTWRTLMILTGAPLILACADASRYEQAIAVLIDVSGTYADQKSDVVKIVKRDVLPAMEPGDTLVVLRIDSESYEMDNLEVLITLDARPSRANAQKLALAQKLDDFALGKTRSDYTDIPGAMMLAAEYLREMESRSRVMLVFSDMREDLPRGARRQLGQHEFDGIRVVAMNVKRLDSDNSDPDFFRGRLARWQDRVVRSGAEGWDTFMDSSKLSDYLSRARQKASI